MRRLLPILAAAALGSAVTAAAIVLPAGASGDSETRDERAGPRLPDREQALERIREFEACMREHGFGFGDDTTVRVTPEGVWVNGEKVDRERFREARRECGSPILPLRSLLPALEGLPDLERLPDAAPPKLRERLEQFRRCVRDRDETTDA